MTPVTQTIQNRQLQTDRRQTVFLGAGGGGQGTGTDGHRDGTSTATTETAWNRTEKVVSHRKMVNFVLCEFFILSFFF